MQAIIIAAGLGSRLMPHTDAMPKCLLNVGGKTILQRALDNFNKSDINKISIVRGHRAEKIDVPNVSFFENTDYQNNNILHSLFCARQAMDDGFIFSYSDIVYNESILKKLLNSTADISLIVDRSWRDTYIGRDKHPITEAELVKIDGGRVVKIGKDIVVPDDASGEFIGLAKFSKLGAKILIDEFDRLLDFYKNIEDQKFQNAKLFRKAYFTDMAQELIDRGHEVVPVEVDRGWHEIDTEQDLERASRYLNN